MAVAAVFQSRDAEDVLQVVLMFGDRTELLVKNGLCRMDHIDRICNHVKSSDQKATPKLFPFSDAITNDHNRLVWLQSRSWIQSEERLRLGIGGMF